VRREADEGISHPSWRYAAENAYIVVLDELLAPVCPQWTWPIDELRFLSRSAVFLRYPGESAEKQEGKEAMGVTKKIRARLLLLLGDGNE
jgi:hypothetical protein